MHHPSHISQKFLVELFAIAFLACLLLVWYTTIVKKDYFLFTDPETVPAPTDFLAPILGFSENTDQE